MSAPFPIHLYIQNLDAGGAQPVMVYLANELAARGFATTLIANNVRGVWREHVALNVAVHDLSASNFFHASLKLFAHLRKTRPPVLISALAHANVAAIAAARLSGTDTKIIAVEHTTTSRWLARLRPSRKVMFGKLIPLLYGRADALVSVSSAAGKDLASVVGIPPDRVTIIRNGSPSMESLEGLEPPRSPWFDDPTVPVILAAGRLAPEKDYATLLEAFACLRSNHSARLMLLGDGPLRAELEAVAERLGVGDDVSFEGYVTPVLPYFLHGSLFVLSSKFEGFPMVLVEALSCGLPIVSTDCESGPREILDSGEYGELVPVGDAGAMADAMSRALVEPGNQAARRARAREFSINRMVDGYVAIATRTLGDGL